MAQHIEAQGPRNVYLRRRGLFIQLFQQFDPSQLIGHAIYVEPNSNDHIRAILFGRMASPEEGEESLNKNSRNILISMRRRIRHYMNTGEPSFGDPLPDHLLNPEIYRGGSKKRKVKKRKVKKNKVKSRRLRKNKKLV